MFVCGIHLYIHKKHSIIFNVDIQDNMSYFISTRNKKNRVDSRHAIIKGLADDGGLFVMEEIKKIDDIYRFKDLSYIDLAFEIISLFFDDLNKGKLYSCIMNAYEYNFSDLEVTPVVKKGGKYFLELYHGPTCAFKDVALSFLPRILPECNKGGKPLMILTATSGDTGKAALEGFRDVEGTYIKVLYPHKMVSMVQEKQMTTTSGNNIDVIAVEGNFDDCQRMAKEILAHRHFKEYQLCSANSINIGRLIPQVVYYFKAYFDLLDKKEINRDERIDFVVPSGNFGDILAGYLAKRMGLPIDKLICASNRNNVLTDFINTGIYDANRQLYNTSSPSIDILISSNLERLLYLKSEDTDKVSKYMNALKEDKKFIINEQMLEDIQADFAGLWASEEEIKACIRKTYKENDYLIDTHTAAALACADRYEDGHKKIILATASPFKFAKDVYEAIFEEEIADDLDSMEKLARKTHVEIPDNLFMLRNLEVRFADVIAKDDLDALCSRIGESDE